MLIDANALRDGDRIGSDVCVIGAGAAGITLARALARSGLRVALLEGGGLDPERASQRLYDLASVGVPYGPVRMRCFGGSSNCWGGLCHVLDEDDFAARAWIAHSGWPIGKTDLDPYYDEALAVLDIPARRTFADVERDTDDYPRLLGRSGDAFAPLLWLESPPTRLGKKYRQEIADSDRVRCYLHANAVEIVPNGDATAIVAVRVRTLGGRRLTFVARQYVVSTGGIENARLLLCSDSVVAGGLGNHDDLVGRYFMEHVFSPVGRMVVVSPPGTRGFQEEYAGWRAARELPGVANDIFGFRATRAFCERHRLVGLSVNAFPPSAKAEAAEEAVGDLIAEPMGADAEPRARRVRRYSLIVFGELAPNPESRVRLDSATDALGQRKAVLDLRQSPTDQWTLRKGLRAFALAVARSGHGRVELALPDIRAPLGMAGGHHMGTTRMSDDPRAGVTDRNGTVHGIANLHVAGSSLFVTGGFANPTLTIVALALRLAEHLRRLRPAG